MVVAIAGGALQGLEVTYLAKKAGFETLLLDRRMKSPATGICDGFVALDLCDHEALTRALTGALGHVDLVVPATENGPALQSLVMWCGENGMPLAFDPGAYAISSSKNASNGLFRKLGVPVPAPWPDCGFPVLAKPDEGSGSQGVEVFPDLEGLEARFGQDLPAPGSVLQAFVTGPAHSIEVMGCPGDYHPLQITDLEMDRDYSCKRVLAPSRLHPDLTCGFERMAVKLAEAVGLSGIMDVEAIVHEGQLKVLEIDARFPSQTPIAIYHSTGINLVERLVEIFLPQAERAERAEYAENQAPYRPVRGSVLEHICVRDGALSVCGEHIMAEHGPLHLETDFFGADEALTSLSPGTHEWVATLMVTGSNLEEAWKRRDEVIGAIRDRFGPVI